MKKWILVFMISGVATWAAAASTIQGTVTNYAGEPLSSINVEAYKFNGSWWEQQDSTSTDGTGHYTLSGLSAGDYLVYFQDWNGNYIPQWYDNVLVQEAATSIVVGISETISNINARLAPASKITGMVTNSIGDGISLFVEAYRYNGSWWEQWAYDYSDGTGAYSIGGLPHGIYRIKFSQWEGDYATEWYNDTPFEDNAESIRVPPISIVSNINAMLGPGAKITGTVTGPGGTPLLENISVGAYLWDGSDWVYVDSTSTDSNGIYTVGGLPPGECLVQFWDWQGTYAPEWFSNGLNQAQALPITTVADNTRSNINAALSVAAGISGTVTAPNGITPVSHISVTAYRWTGAFWDYAQSDQTDGAGQYDITGLASGRYHVVFQDWNYSYLPEWYSNANSQATAHDIMLSEGSLIANINASLATGAHIAGTVTGTNGVTPLAGINVNVWRQNGTEWDYMGWAGTDASGHYDVGGLDTGIYRAVFFSSDGRYADEYYNNQTNWELADPIPVTTFSTVGNINATLAEVPPTSISGTVTGPGGTPPLGDIWVNLYGYNGTTWVYDQTVATLPDGSFLFGGLNAGTNRVQFIDPAGIYQPEWYDNTNSLANASNVVVRNTNQVMGINASLALVPQTGISGTVSNSVTGDPIEGILVELYVYIYFISSWIQIDSTSTAPNGTYTFTGVDPGSYRIAFHDLSGTYVTEFYDNTSDIYAATDIPVNTGEMTTGKDAALDPVPATGISGLVTETGSGIVLPGITVKLYQDLSGWWVVDSQETAADGTYEFNSLWSGTFRIGFEDASGNHVTEYYDNVDNVDSAMDIDVTDGNMETGKDAILDLTPKTGISGLVTEAGSGNTLNNIDVYVLKYDDDSFSWVAYSATVTGNNGIYEFTSLPAGTYRIQFYDSSGNHIGEYYDNVDNVDSAMDIDVTDGNMETGKDAILDLIPKTGISGLVTEAGSGIVLPGITVNLYQDFGGWSIVYAQLTAGDGTYAFTALPEGIYRIEFLDESGNHLLEFFNNVTNFDLATEISVTDGNMETGKDAILTKLPAPPVIHGFRRKTGNTWEILFTCDEESSFILQKKYAITNQWDDFGDPTNCVSGTHALVFPETAQKCYWRLKWVP